MFFAQCYATLNKEHFMQCNYLFVSDLHALIRYMTLLNIEGQLFFYVYIRPMLTGSIHVHCTVCFVDQWHLAVCLVSVGLILDNSLYIWCLARLIINYPLHLIVVFLFHRIMVLHHGTLSALQMV